MAPKKKKQCATALANKIRKKSCIIHFEGADDKQFVLMNTERFEKLKNIADNLPVDESPVSKVCAKLPASFSPTDGYHRVCYNRFVARKRKLPELGQDVHRVSMNSKRRSGSMKDSAVFNPDCIFCESSERKNIRINNVRQKEKLTTFENEGWQSVFEQAEEKGDDKLMTRIRGFDLVACKAMFHRSCKKLYMIKPDSWRSNNQESVRTQADLELAHTNAFSAVCLKINEEILERKSVFKLTELRDIYVNSLQGTPYPNNNYRNDKLKRKIENMYKDKVSFCEVRESSSNRSYIVYSTGTDLSKVIQSVYRLGEKDSLKHAALQLRSMILNCFKEREQMTWPPSLKYLGESDMLPDKLLAFLCTLISGNETPLSSKTQRLLLSIGQDICRAVTNGEWKLPKHILLCMTLRHLFRSKQLTTLLNRFGHCENHSFSLELETAIAQSVQQSSSVLTNKIIRAPQGQSVFHSEFDNYDQLVNNISGKGSIHTAHGIMLQEVTTDHPHTECEPLCIPKDKKRSLVEEVIEPLEECYVANRQSPHMAIQQTSVPGSEESKMHANAKNIAWLLLRALHDDPQRIPSWAAFVSVTGSVPDRLTSIDYYPVIFSPITEYATVQECLRQAEKATDEVGQTYVFSTYDLGVCMKAYPLLWKFPVKFSRHIIMIGTFHLQMGYLNMIGKKMEGSGFTDILMESNLISAGSLHGVLNGKNYNRSVRCHKVMFESLHRLILEEFLKGDVLSLDSLPAADMDVLKLLLDNPSEETFIDFLENASIMGTVQKYIEFCEAIQNGKLGKTAKFWMSYLDHVSLILDLMRAVKTNNFELYAYCITLMPDLFFSFGGHNYSRFLTYFSMFIANVESSHPGALEKIRLGVFSVARSRIPGNRCAVDKTMEETFMKSAKSRGGAGGGGTGICGISQNYTAYQRWVRTMDVRCKYLDTTNELADIQDIPSDSVHHRELRPTELRKSEVVVKKTVESIKSFMNPFTIDEKSNLYNVSSGATIPIEIENDVMNAECRGREEKEKFIRERLCENQNFFEPVKKLKLKTMADSNKRTKIRTKDNKVIELKQHGNIAFQLLVKSQEKKINIDLEFIMQFQLTPVPYCLGTPDGFLAKTNKAKAFQFLTKETHDARVPVPEKTLIIVDGNAVFHAITDIPETFKGVCEKIFSTLPKESHIVFSTDSYNKNSIKSQERQRRGQGEKFLVKGSSMKRPSDWKYFLSNDENKEMLARMMLQVWSDDSFAVNLKDRKVILIVEGKAFELTSSDGLTVCTTELHSLTSSQEETDTRVILYALHGASNGYEAIKVRSPDSDIFFILLHHASKVSAELLFDTGYGNNRRLINVSNLALEYGQPKCSALMALHAFTGCDTTSCFKGIGKLKPYKTLQKSPEYEKSIGNLGDTWDISVNSLSVLQKFTCSIYGNKNIALIDKLRLNLLQRKCDNKNLLDSNKRVDLSSLPPCLASLKQHIIRTNYQVAIWKRADENFPESPPPEENGWVKEDNVLEPLWCEGDVLPAELVSLLGEEENCDSDDLDMEIESDESEDSDNELLS